MSGLKQATLNRHVNSEAISAYIQGLESQRQEVEGHAWVRGGDLTEKETTAITTLRRAETAMTLALELAQEGERSATTLAYDRLRQRAQPS